MPWKGEKDPYKIWLSEIILQQTRVEQGTAYYLKFIKSFPTVHHLAAAPEQQVFKLWEGLGYYSRCKNLIASAKYISTTLGGRFPEEYKEIRLLKGIGPYTAAAIASFAFNKPFAVVDGNVNRLLARYFGISTPIDNTSGKKLFNLLADALLYKKNAATYNQAIMDFGAMICKPQQPLCTICIHNKQCEAYKCNWIKQLPVKEKLLRKKIRWFYYFIIEYDNQVYLRQRIGKDIWENLFEFVLSEHDVMQTTEQAFLKDVLTTLLGGGSSEIQQVSKVFRQQLTHQTISGQFVTVRINCPASIKGYHRIPKEELSKYPFPKIISSWLLQQIGA